ncbi:hypothetical protein GWI33_019075 [Rhynchophorus ferrugineus]|uniref:Uncharacterized protein n=1 Tax=Rhynchophorus ferrugineus TaxID=354439 RepID=A0A834I627_RHYFE|nr:hypothetical protein GWI33_019075 [Rhynchophorus ferrugineus]
MARFRRKSDERINRVPFQFWGKGTPNAVDGRFSFIDRPTDPVLSQALIINHSLRAAGRVARGIRQAGCQLLGGYCHSSLAAARGPPNFLPSIEAFLFRLY